ncbi:PQQ-binding-like beta-propeller repeat protein [Planctomicrobium sp. SH661]|uniref:outer membrane protein assembly factor BamB family protein n=1 Tax=Planctomicrobium sp. SH661 TaxID=3448124 RepID=UPI003F5BB1AD
MKKQNRASVGLRSFACLLLLLLIGSAKLVRAQAQFGPVLVPPAAQMQGQGQGDPSRRLPRDPLTQASVLKAVQAIESEDVTSGLETLQELLDEDSDFFINEPGQRPRSLFRELSLLIREHREDYERLYGPVAAKLLSEAQTDQNRVQLEAVSRRFGLTNAGATALRELANIDRDRGEPELAARRLEELASHPQTADPRPLLLEAALILAGTGQESRAQSLLSSHSETFPADDPAFAALKSASKDPIRGAADARIYEWRTPYGDVRHTGQAAPAPALFDDAWSATLIHDEFDFPALLVAPDVGHHLAEESRNLTTAIDQQVRANPARIAMPAGRPLIVNDLVIAAGPGTVKAFDLKSGELVWNGVDLDETFDYLAKQSYSAGESHDPVREEMRELFASVRGWRDLTSSSMSTDGQNVYAISNCQLVGTTSPLRMMQNTQRHSLLPQRMNRLTAYSLGADGKKLWSIGEPEADWGARDPSGADAVIEAREIFFHGAPLPVQGHLYVLGEERGQIQIFEIDPATGSVIWSLGLLNPDRDLVWDDVRRLAGLMPAYSDGLLICPTGEGSITAVDPEKRQVVWTHMYAESVPPLRNQIMLMRMMRPQNQNAAQSREELLADQRWFDSRVMLSSDAVVFTPPDDDGLVCLNLRDGTARWKIPLQRMQMVYAPTIFGDNLLLVGRSEITSISLADGTPTWKSPIPIPGPSGRGVRMGDQFLQPFLSGEIGVIDLKSGRLLTRLPLLSGQIPGNLVAHGGQLIMQTSTGVTAFQSSAILEKKIADRLQENTADPEALAMRGEWRLQQGEFDAGLSDLKQSLAAINSQAAQQVLAWSLLDGLRTDFATYRNQAETIERTLGSRSQQLQFLRTYAQGLQKVGEYEPAFERYLEVLRILPWPESLSDFDSNWAATDSRWVLARLDELLSVSNEATQKKLRQILAAWVRNTTDTALVLRVLPAFPAGWVDGETILRRLAATEGTDANAHEREGVLRSLYASSDPVVRTQAAAQLILQARRYKDAVTARQMLAHLELKDVPLPGVTPQTSFELAKKLRQQADFADLIHQDFVWPDQVRVAESTQAQIRTSSFQIPLLGAASPPLQGWSFFLDSGGANIEIFDQHGQHRGRIATSYGGTRFASEGELGRYVCMHNHLVLVVLLDRFLVLDFLTDPQSPKILVVREFARDDEIAFAGRGALMGIPRPGTRSMVVELRNGRMGSNVGPLTDSVLCYGSENNLIAINPVNGAELWRRRDMPIGAEILGDENYVVLKPSDGSPIQILRATDGGFVKSIPALPEGTLNCLTRDYGDWGIGLPVVDTAEGDMFRFRMFDPVRETAFWTHTAPAGTRWTIVQGKKVAFFSPDRKLSIRDGMTGSELFSAQVPVQQPVGQISVLEFPDEWILLTSAREMKPLNTPDYLPTMRSREVLMADVEGPVVALDRQTGKVLWSKTLPSQEILTQGPSNWPLLVFNRVWGASESLVLNRATGDVIRQKHGNDDGTGSVNWMTETQPPRIQLKFGSDRATLLFGAGTDTPPASDSPTAPEQEE